MNSSITILDEILLQGKSSGDNIGIGFSGDDSKKMMTSPTRKWVVVGAKPNQNSKNSRTEEDAELWHKKLGHSNYRNIQQLIAKEVVCGLPNLVMKEITCGECKPKGFIDADRSDHVYRLKKALYGLNQAPRAWYESLTIFLLKNEYAKGGWTTHYLSRKKGIN
ncbi:hypothetical protein LIER_02807 [Lithospermum erythrorhizon]|uniref:Uncharacterized protein n=1 Tax=Lithospermum erythrorhizon TaxID=34254 RepID=A0AAV3NQT1_LITER